ncbi:hypothetical protein SISSUDRAFT_468625 [Sistotremastrum suecicum HHB10207 ss-3]|uniref:Uncharacterized protein n=1 Tax=Sistotremastrum suecicum HHB10207 ss-3 TaxID=1314776 RepID=A0A165Y662_9AGAM|nr:hypothetical protein SISSUDRAFT_468625 [Sistotremastrum suecicum HHB10207 ss-3]
MRQRIRKRKIPGSCNRMRDYPGSFFFSRSVSAAWQLAEAAKPSNAKTAMSDTSTDRKCKTCPYRGPNDSFAPRLNGSGYLTTCKDCTKKVYVRLSTKKQAKKMAKRNESPLGGSVGDTVDVGHQFELGNASATDATSVGMVLDPAKPNPVDLTRRVSLEHPGLSVPWEACHRVLHEHRRQPYELDVFLSGEEELKLNPELEAHLSGAISSQDSISPQKIQLSRAHFWANLVRDATDYRWNYRTQRKSTQKGISSTSTSSVFEFYCAQRQGFQTKHAPHADPLKRRPQRNRRIMDRYECEGKLLVTLTDWNDEHGNELGEALRRVRIRVTHGMNHPPYQKEQKLRIGILPWASTLDDHQDPSVATHQPSLAFDPISHSHSAPSLFPSPPSLDRTPTPDETLSHSDCVAMETTDSIAHFYPHRHNEHGHNVPESNALIHPRPVFLLDPVPAEPSNKVFSLVDSKYPGHNLPVFQVHVSPAQLSKIRRTLDTFMTVLEDPEGLQPDRLAALPGVVKPLIDFIGKDDG